MNMHELVTEELEYLNECTPFGYVTLWIFCGLMGHSILSLYLPMEDTWIPGKIVGKKEAWKYHGKNI